MHWLRAGLISVCSVKHETWKIYKINTLIKPAEHNRRVVKSHRCLSRSPDSIGCFIPVCGVEMEGVVEGCLGFLYNLLVVVCIGLLLLRVAEGRSVRWLALLVVSGVTLSCLVHSNALKAGLVSVLCSAIHYVGREEVMLPTQNKAVLITGKTLSCLLLPDSCIIG